MYQDVSLMRYIRCDHIEDSIVAAKGGSVEYARRPAESQAIAIFLRQAAAGQLPVCQIPAVKDKNSR